MKISVIGTGYVGLVSGVCLASRGNNVTCVDIDSSKVDAINSGRPPIHEQGLEDLLKAVIQDGSFNATTNLESAVQNSDLTLLAVGTPFDGEHIDLSYIETASRQIGEALQTKSGFHTVVVKSTVVPGTTENVVGKIVSQYSDREIGLQLGLGMNPEFLREGEAVTDFMNPDRIVIGAVNQATADAMHELYSQFPDVDKLDTSPRTAEMIKYTANSLLATLISFSNEIGNLCASVRDVDIEEVMQGVWLDKRISPLLNENSANTDDTGQPRCIPGMTSYLRAGCGFGGSCFPKDVSALIAYGKQHGSNMQVLDAVMSVNADQPDKLVELADIAISNNCSKAVVEKNQSKIAVLGLAFKAGTDDVRESAAIPVIQGLQDLGYNISAYDPIAMGNAKIALESAADKIKSAGNKNSVKMAENINECIQNADAIVVTTAWPEFQDLPALVAKMEVQPYMIDGRRMFKPEDFRQYAGIGLMQSSDSDSLSSN